MPIIILMMHRKAIMQGLINKLQDSPDIRLVYQSNYHSANVVIRSCNAKTALIEVAESGNYNTSYCLRLCRQIRKYTPECKLLMMCPEQDEKGVKQVIDAKGKGLIDDFVFYDVTIDYLASKLISL
ncbi:MAG TPA: hypothetical protein GX707_17910 [Epulopiscium sp.]|nr:hypothetical protein [Candidatus Epulonipiscium sp.]